MTSFRTESKLHWHLASSPDEAMFGQFPELHPAVVSLLWNRGLRSREEVDAFLNPDYTTGIHDPFLFREMAKACERTVSALEKGERVVIYGDYDADGVTSSVILVSVLREIAGHMGLDGGSIRSYIPHREREGYGLRSDTVRQLLEEGMDLMISVDCGIGSAEEIALAKEGGCDVIVIDHHQVPEKVPDCLIIHPSSPGENYPFKRLAAVGVAFKFACAMMETCRKRGMEIPPGREKWLLDLVAIATVTDVVPLIGENRVLERYGLVVLNKTRRLGLKRLMDESGLTSGSVDTRSIGFGIGPRINAASRLDHASVAFECLMAEDDDSANRLARQLNGINQERQRLTEQISRDAILRADAAPNRLVHILAGNGWPAGVVGIIAGKLANRTGRPSFIFGQDGERYVGSGRSIPGFDIMEALEVSKGFLSRYGGHPQACGLTIEGQENYESFRNAVSEYAASKLSGQDLRPILELEAEIRTSQIDWKLIRELERFEPFGEGNLKPNFLMSDLQVTSLACIGKDSRHVRLGLRGDGSRDIKAIGFGLAQVAVGFPPGSRIDAAVELGINEWNGRKEIQVRLIDIRQADSKKVRPEMALAKESV